MDLFLGMFNGILVIVAVAAKILTAHLVVRQKRQVARMQARSQQIVFRMKNSHKRLKSLQNTRAMMERKRDELRDSVAELKTELADWETRVAEAVGEYEAEELQSGAVELAERVLQDTAEEEGTDGVEDGAAEDEQAAGVQEKPGEDEGQVDAEDEPAGEDDGEEEREIRTSVDRRRSLYDDDDEGESRQIRTYVDKIRDKVRDKKDKA